MCVPDTCVNVLVRLRTCEGAHARIDSPRESCSSDIAQILTDPGHALLAVRYLSEVDHVAHAPEKRW